ncbi:unnamed protein product [Haemonchus placei]|uniref:MARVEL domain-containing protein n=1 Tax=Haemonchus placei TaxID=6290 RepID=A0A0N4X5K0_HAEPC|nr:unnamed protein product [Haemonchus placei]
MQRTLRGACQYVCSTPRVGSEDQEFAPPPTDPDSSYSISTLKIMERADILMFPAPLLVSAISLGLTICGTASLCLSCSIFDFIVMREMYYTVPDTHGGLLCASSILCAFCTYLAMQMAASVGKYAFHAHPKQFQDASHWYYTRLRASAVLFTIECLLQLLQLCVLYLGIQCRYRTFKQLPQKPDIVLRAGTMFA